MNHEQHAKQGRTADRDVPLRIEQIRRFEGGRIRQCRDGFFERHPVLAVVFGGLLGIPLEVAEDDRRHGMTVSIQGPRVKEGHRSHTFARICFVLPTTLVVLIWWYESED